MAKQCRTWRQERSQIPSGNQTVKNAYAYRLRTRTVENRLLAMSDAHGFAGSNLHTNRLSQSIIRIWHNIYGFGPFLSSVLMQHLRRYMQSWRKFIKRTMGGLHFTKFRLQILIPKPAKRSKNGAACFRCVSGPRGPFGCLDFDLLTKKSRSVLMQINCPSVKAMLTTWSFRLQLYGPSADS